MIRVLRSWPRLVPLIAVTAFALVACLPATPRTGLTTTGRLLALPQAALTSLPVPDAPSIKVLADPIPFPIEQNGGQTDPSIGYLLRAGDVQIGFATGGPRLVLTDTAPDAAPACTAQPRDPRHPAEPAICPAVSYMLALSFVGADTAAPVGSAPSETLVSRFVGSEMQAQTGIPAFDQVAYPNAWPGIDVLYQRAPGVHGLKSTYIIDPGANPEAIRLAWRGAELATVDESGALVLTTPVGTVSEAAPVAWQDRADGSPDPVTARFTLLADGRDGEPVEVGFKLGRFDPGRPLIIDPVLAYSSYLGGSGNDRAFGVAIDSSSNLYVVGQTFSNNFPTTAGAVQTAFGGASDAFVAKVNATGTALTYASYLGGSAIEEATAVAVDTSGAAYVVGFTSSTNFPTTAGAFQTTFGGAPDDTFVVKVSPAGSSLLYASYLGGSGNDEAWGVKVDNSGNAYVVGSTSSPNFPITAGAFQTIYSGNFDLYAVKLNTTGSALIYATYLGGSGADPPNGMAIDSSGAAYVVGSTSSADFPTTGGAAQTTYGGNFDGFVAKVSPTGTALIYASYLGGSDTDQTNGVAIDTSGNAYVAGYTRSTNFPSTAGALQTTLGGGFDAFAAKLNAAGSSLIFSTYLGGSGADQGQSMSIDTSNNLYIVGQTSSNNFPITADAFQTTNGSGASDAFVAKVNTAGSALLYSSYLGSSGLDQANGVAVSASGDAYVVGQTASNTFPTTAGAFRTAYGGGANDAFVAKVVEGTVGPTASPTTTPTGTPPTVTPTGTLPTVTPTGTLPTATPTGTLPTVTPTGTPTITPPIVTENKDDSPKPLSEEQRQNRQLTNRSNRDDLYIEGNVVEVHQDELPPCVIIGNRDGLVVVRLLCGSECPAIRVGDYLMAAGEKQHEQLFDAADVSVSHMPR